MVKIVCVEAYVGNPFHSTRMSSVSRPGVSRHTFAAISPVVYICATLGASSNPAKVKAVVEKIPGIETADYEVTEVEHTVEALTKLFKGAQVVSNMVGPFVK